MNYHSTEPLNGRRRRDVIRYINMKLASMGQPIFEGQLHMQEDGMTEQEFVNLAESLLENYKEKMRLLSGEVINPVDNRIQNFINNYLSDVEFDKSLRIPFDSFVLDKPGIGREVSLPPDRNSYSTPHFESYRIRQGILHNPASDRRTTQGSFHIVKGGLPIPDDKRAVPKITFAHLLNAALNPPDDFLILPFTASQEKKAKVFISLLLRPTVSPEVKGVSPHKSMEVRFFAPGAFVSNLDFVESIFGNAGDPYLFKNDAALDPEHWSGHTGCIILAPHLTQLKKKDVGLPNWEDATEKMRHDGMCWKSEDEYYNNGVAFKLTCRDESGVVVTLIADNYFGYSKKEVKTQLSYAANLSGNCEEEHAGGTLAFSRRNMGSYFDAETLIKRFPDAYRFEDIKKHYSSLMNLQDDNYGIDKIYNEVYYIPENAQVDLYKSRISWEYEGSTREIKLLKNHHYVLPCGFKVHMEKHPFTPDWRLVVTQAEGSFLHKPSTVSGGGKSEISKSLLNAIIYGQFFIDDIEKDFAKAQEMIDFDYSKRWNTTSTPKQDNRSLLDPNRTLGSVIKLLTPYRGYSVAYNRYLKNITDHVKALVLLIKRMSVTDGDYNKNWREYFSVDKVNGRKGHALMFDNRKISTSYLRVGFGEQGSWNVFSLRPDFIAAAKVQMEDDISATLTLPAHQVEYLRPGSTRKSVKFVQNCEYLFFQRPDEAINKGYDKQAESDLSQMNNFTTNYQPLTSKDGKEIIEEAIEFDKYTLPIKDLIKSGSVDDGGVYFISPSHPRRLADGSISENPRYLQTRPEFNNPTDGYLAHVGIRFSRKVPHNKPTLFPVNDVLPGRRNNPSNKAKGIRPLSVYAPIHYQELPELFMDFVCSLTGKSPSTTGAGSEGALTKGPFNMLVPTTDLNNALVSYILTGYNAFSSAAGHVGPKYRFDHDISILIPEIWCRLEPKEKSPEYLIEEGVLEKLNDFEYNGEKILASRLGYRINEAFTFKYLGRIFAEPMSVFSREILRPELQSIEDYVDGIKNICEAQKKVALQYFEDGSVESAIPPLKALLHIMAYGQYNGKEITDPEVRDLFKREYVIESEWYKERLQLKQTRDITHWKKLIDYIESFMAEEVNQIISRDLNLIEKLEKSRVELEKVSKPDYLNTLVGTIGADPLFKGI
jgi:phosphoenolpyruvate carboxykinase (diphosphate)